MDVNIPLFSYLQKRFSDRFASDLIYHYTNEKMLDIFFRDEAGFYLTEYAYLNDAHEIVEGWDCIQSYLVERCGVPVSKVEAIQHGYYSAVQSDLPWLMSFSYQRDSLSQWRMYTEKEVGGYAFGFDWKLLRERIVEVKYKLQPCRYDVFLSPCFYTENEILDVLDFFWGRYKDLIVRVKSSTKIEGSDCVSMMMKVHLLSSIIKHESFKEEREWRLVRMMNYDTSINACECIGGKPRVKAMLFDKEHPLRNYLREIVVSPHGNGDQLMMKAEKLCCRHGLQIKVARSASPYNGR